jgi:hypothetical protein
MRFAWSQREATRGRRRSAPRTPLPPKRARGCLSACRHGDHEPLEQLAIYGAEKLPAPRASPPVPTRSDGPSGPDRRPTAGRGSRAAAHSAPNGAPQRGCTMVGAKKTAGPDLSKAGGSTGGAKGSKSRCIRAYPEVRRPYENNENRSLLIISSVPVGILLFPDVPRVARGTGRGIEFRYGVNCWASVA